MHEISLVRDIFKTLEEQLNEDEMQRLSKVHLDLGVLSNIHPILMENALGAVKQDYGKYMDVQFKMNVIPVRIYCASCDAHSDIHNYSFRCIYCGAPNNNIVAGEEMLITKIELAESA